MSQRQGELHPYDSLKDDSLKDESLKDNEKRGTSTLSQCSSMSTDATMVASKELVANMIDREKEEKKIVRALDLRMMPWFCLFYFTDFLDRANIGNAALAGIQSDLNLTATELSTAISAFYITYILFEVPSNVILKRTRPSIWLSSIMLLWGAATLVMAFVTNFTGLFICRLVLGLAQSGYVPAILYQLSLVYKPSEISMRVACLIAMASLSGIVSGPIAYASSFLEGKRGLHGWQYLLILEATPTVALSLVSYCCLFDDIQQVRWLTAEQKALQYVRMHEGVSHDESKNINFKTFVTTFTDWKLWLFSAVYMFTAVNITSFSIFSPTIIVGFGYPVLTSQLLTAPPSIVSAIFILTGGYLANRFNLRSPIICIGFGIMAVGYMLLLVLHDTWALYGSMFIIPIGMGLLSPSVIGWSTVNFQDTNVRAVAVAAVVMIGNMGSVAASFLYPSVRGPHHYFGNTFNLACAVLGCVTSAFTGYMLYRANKRMEQKDVDEKGPAVDGSKPTFTYYY
ncbi:major facilitator superfamily domain-containing protein [Gongronella butleri]|nr:major facilitator superfamily domain-containing protein [Gongronella butleri]